MPSAIVEATTEMGRPIIFSKVILLTAFIPLYTMQRVEGRIFKPMALTLTFALIAGTVFAIVVVPVLASIAVRGGIAAQRSVDRALAGAPLPAGAGLRFKVTHCRLCRCGPVAGRRRPYFTPSWAPNSCPNWTKATSGCAPSPPNPFPRPNRPKSPKMCASRLASFPEVRYVVSQLGRPDDGTDINGWDITEYSVGLKPREQWNTAHTRDALCEAMARKLKEIPGIDTQFSQYIEDNVNEAVSGVKSELAIKLFGDDPDKLQHLADQIVNIIKTVPGAADVGTDLLLGQPQIQITINRAAIARYGLAVADMQTIVATAIGGQAATQVLEGERTFDLVVKLDPKSVADLESIRNIPVFGSNGERLTLGTLAAVDVQPGLARIEREENERRTAIKLSVRDRDLGSLVAEAQQKVEARVRLPSRLSPGMDRIV